MSTAAFNERAAVRHIDNLVLPFADAEAPPP
jgi:hypothetical protein